MRVIREIGTGPESVYVYAFPSDIDGDVHPCKIGKTSGCPKNRVNRQQASMKEEPVILLLIKTRNCKWLEKRLHLALADSRLDTYGREWFMTSPEYVANLIDSGIEGVADTVVRLPSMLGAALARARTSMEMTQSALSDSVGIRTAAVSNAEVHGEMKTDTLFRLLSALDLELVVRPRQRGAAEDIEAIF